MRDGHLQNPWTTGDLLNSAELAREFSEVNLRTQPPNRSVSLPGLGMGTGANVASGSDARFWRVGRQGNALLYSVHDGDGVPADAVLPAAVEVGPEPLADNTTVEAIVESDLTISEVPGSGTGCLPGGEALRVLGLLVRQMQQEEAWDERLRNYVWKGRAFEETGHALADLTWQGSVFARFISHGIAWTPEDQVRAVAWATDIFTWGGTRQKNPVTWQKVHDTLANAVLNRAEYPEAPMNSGYTKVAAFGTAWLEETENGRPQVINDSRVATSLTCRLDGILQEHGLAPADVFPGLGRVDAARGGTRPRQLVLDWPSAYQRWSGQFAATSVVVAIRDILNGDGSYPAMPCGGREVPWTARGVEAVLFMDGY